MNCTIALVLRSGGPYSVDYVKAIRNVLYKFNPKMLSNVICLTDFHKNCFKSIPEVQPIPLKYNFPSWWSKLELFRPDIPNEKMLYLDLDTVLLGKIDALLDIVNKTDFAPLMGFNQKLKPLKSRNLASGVMIGNFRKHTHIYSTFCEDPEYNMNVQHENWQHGDQGFIASQVDMDALPRLQDFLPNNYIVGKKLISQNGGIPKSARVIAWSGSPRLAEANNQIGNIWRSHAK